MKNISMLVRGLLCPLFAFAVLSASANLVPGEFMPMVSPVNSGTISPSKWDVPSSTGATQTFTATANPGYRFNSWNCTPPLPSSCCTINGNKITLINNNDLRPGFTLFANFVPGTYTVKFDAQGGKLDGVASLTVTNNQEGGFPDIPTATKSGYTFNGWATNGVPWSVKKGDSVWLTKDTTAFAQWTANKYRVTYLVNDGSGRSSYKDIVFGENYELPSSIPTWTGHTFEGWFTGETDGTRVDDYTKMQRAENHNLYGHWTAAKYKVTFNPGEGGEVSPTFLADVEYDSPYGELPTPTREGFTFVEWRMKDGTPITAETKVSTASDHTLYAVWKGKVYSVEKSVSDGCELTVEPSGEYGKPLSFSWNNGKKTGYTVTNTTAVVSVTTGGAVLVAYTNLTSASYTMTGSYYSSITISVSSLFKPNTYRVSFDSQGGSLVSSKDVTYDALYGELPTPTRSGYAFGGWFTALEGGEEVKSDTKVAITQAQTLYARWTAKSYTVTTKENGAISLTVNETGVFDQPLSIGWTLNAQDGYSTELDKVQIRASESEAGEVLKTYTSGTGVEFTMKDLNSYYSSIVIEATANSLPNSYTVKFDANGARGKMSPLACTYDLAFDLPKQNSYTNLTAKFLGWARDPKATAIEWADEAKGIKNLTQADGGEVTLYAIWQDLQNELTRAAHGVNVILEGGDPTYGITTSFKPVTDAQGYTSASSDLRSAMRLTVNGPGKLSFVWKAFGDETRFMLTIGKIGPQTINQWESSDAGDGWKRVVAEFDSAGDHPAVWDSVASETDDYLLVDKVEWVPAGWEEDPVKPTDDDRRDLAAITFADGELSLSFADSDPRFAYSLHGTNELTAARELWPVLLTTNGTGKAITLKPEAKPNEKSFFYYLEVHSK